MTNLDLQLRATAMRNAPTEPEKRLWRHLSNRQLGGFKLKRKALIPCYFVDFLCPAVALIVEVDGDTHDPAADERRDAFLRQKGDRIVRFTNHDVMANMPGVLEAILTTVTALPPRWPHPNPSPEGEGLHVAPDQAPPLQGRGWGGEQRSGRPPRS